MERQSWSTQQALYGRCWLSWHWNCDWATVELSLEGPLWNCEWATVEVWSLNCNSNSVVVQLALVVEVKEALVVQLALVVQMARPSGCLLAFAAM